MPFVKGNFPVECPVCDANSCWLYYSKEHSVGPNADCDENCCLYECSSCGWAGSRDDKVGAEWLYDRPYPMDHISADDKTLLSVEKALHYVVYFPATVYVSGRAIVLRSKEELAIFKIAIDLARDLTEE